jgi:hypothetical protein
LPLSFVVRHDDVINSLPKNLIPVTPIFHECPMLMTTLFNLITIRELSHTALANVPPLIHQAIQVFDSHAEQCSDDGLFEGYGAAARVVAAYPLRPTSY